MMAYAFRDIHQNGQDRFASEDFDTIHDLFAEILIRGIGSQVKRGLHCDYRRRSEELSAVRGWLDLTRTSAALSTVRGLVVCEFDECELDTLHNLILKCVMFSLFCYSSVSRLLR